MSWLTLFGLVLKVALALAELVRERKLMDAGAAEATVKSLEENNARVDKARAARGAAAADGMRDDDPYRRD